MKKYYFTFGMKHVAPVGTDREGKSLAHYYVTVEAENLGVASGIMFARYKGQWSRCFSEDMFQNSVARYHLTEYEVIIQEQTSKTA